MVRAGPGESLDERILQAQRRVRDAVRRGDPGHVGPYLRVATRAEALAMAQWDESIVDIRNCKTMRVMVAVDPEVVQLVESRDDLQFLWSQMGYNRVRCRASGHVVPVKLSALS
eukprot:7137199-Alexandrium_andersonii.AAC.1